MGAGFTHEDGGGAASLDFAPISFEDSIGFDAPTTEGAQRERRKMEKSTLDACGFCGGVVHVDPAFAPDRPCLLSVPVLAGAVQLDPGLTPG